ncbi:MAG: DUF434 domain-containing protein [Ignisphaera sp.]
MVVDNSGIEGNRKRVRLSIIFDAAHDYRFLLSRGYSLSQALNIVSQHYLLNEYEKLLLFRCVHSFKYIHETTRKLVCSVKENLGNSTLVIDFYNIILTILTMIKSEDIYLCDDCLVRDLRGSKIRDSERVLLNRVFNIIADILTNYRGVFAEIVIVADKNVSHSLDDVREFSNTLHNTFKEARVTFILSPTPDSKTVSMATSSVIASTDSVIIENSCRILPLTTLALQNIGLKPAIDFPNIFGYTCHYCNSAL